jgi:group I intron endonuclease
MPRNTDYSKSCIYKIVCKNPLIKDFYIGSSVNFKHRIHIHKRDSINLNKNHVVLYKFINNNGGINNWEFIIIEQFPTTCNLLLKQRERYWFDKLKPTLNIYKPLFTNINNESYITDNNLTYNENNKKRASFINKSKQDLIIQLQKENDELKKQIEELITTQFIINMFDK